MTIDKLTFLLLLLTFVGCSDRNVNNTSPAKVVNITENTMLSESSRNVQYVIRKNGVTLDLGGLTHYSNGEYAIIKVQSSNVTVKNGSLKGLGFATGINVQTCVRLSDVDPLKNSPENHEPLIYDRCNKGSSIQSVKFENLKTGVYISSYVSNSKIENSNFVNIDRMAIYLDAGSKDTIIENNRFENIGFRHIEDYGRPRGSISIDSSYDNIIIRNYFNSQPKFSKKLLNPYRIPELEFYRNCGEPTFGDVPLPRIHGADNNTITNNTFENVGLVAWFKYRNHDQLGSCVGNYPDQSNNNNLIGSTLINVEEFVYDEGENNTW